MKTCFVISYYSENIRLLYREQAALMLTTREEMKKHLRENIREKIKQQTFDKSDYVNIIVAENESNGIKFEWRINEI